MTRNSPPLSQTGMPTVPPPLSGVTVSQLRLEAGWVRIPVGNGIFLVVAPDAPVMLEGALSRPVGVIEGKANYPSEVADAPLSARELHARRVAHVFNTLVSQMMPSLAEMDPVPNAMVQQAQRRAALRTELLATGAVSYRGLAVGRAVSPAAVRQWVRRARDRSEIFTVDHDGEAFIPVLLLDADLAPRPEFRPVIEVRTEAGEDGWGLWAWLVHPTPWLDGAVPAELLFSQPEAVLDAARRRATNAA